MFELYALMKGFGTGLYLKGLWADVSGTSVPLEMRTDANNLVTTATTTHAPEQKETTHMIDVLRREAAQGAIEEFGHIVTELCLADSLTKRSAKPDQLIKTVNSGILEGLDVHPPFRSGHHYRA